MTLAWLALGAVAALGWFETGARVASHLGLGAASPAVGIAVGATAVVTIARWARGDRTDRALAAGVCPRCGSTLASQHEHARPGALAGGLMEWRCTRCEFSRIEPLTCEHCAS
jgi:ribosomal protein S27AE